MGQVTAPLLGGTMSKKRNTLTWDLVQDIINGKFDDKKDKEELSIVYRLGDKIIRYTPTKSGGAKIHYFREVTYGTKD
jgi:hypothetical protein